MKVFAPAVTAIALILAAGSASAAVIKVDVGFTLNPFFLRLACDKIAAERGGSVVKSERSGADKTGVCYIDVPRKDVTFTQTPGIVATPGHVIRHPAPAVQQTTPGYPDTRLEMVDAGRLWSQEHATERCSALALRKNAEWTGAWTKHNADKKARCQLKVLMQPEPEGVVTRFKTTKIWNDAHAERHCTQLAKENNGRWSGVWRDSRRDKNTSVCMIKVATHHQTKPVNQLVTTPQSNDVRNVKAGAIWDQAHAARKCPVVAQNEKGTWTQRWTKTGPGNESVCEVRFNHISGGATVPALVPAADNTRNRNVAAGSIWDDNQANSKCPVIAANNKAKWTGNWTKTGPGHISVCEISVVVPATTTQAPVSQSTTSTIREVAAGGIWDHAQASRKCPVIAANNKARWTGRWRKINVKNDAVCEIDTRI